MRTSTQVIGVNDAGQMVGEFIDAASVEHGFVTSGGVFTLIDFPGATSTAAAGINSAGDIVGVTSDGTMTPRFSLEGRRLHADRLSARDQHDCLRHQRRRGDRGLLH